MIWNRKRQTEDAEKLGRLEAAEKELESVKARAGIVHAYFSERQQRNHWQEAIRLIIKEGL